MNIEFDLSKTVQQHISVIGDRETVDVGAIENKGWSFVNIYSLVEFRNVYFALIKSSFDGNIVKFVNYCDNNLPFDNKPWTYRKIEEYLNAFRNFRILSPDNKINKDLFSGHQVSNELNENDKEVLKHIFYNYFRFKEIHTWFTDIDSVNRKASVNDFKQSYLKNKGTELYSFSIGKRFTDAFFKSETQLSPIYILDDSKALNRRMMRFWDVYTSWGRSLGVLEKVNIEPLNRHYNLKSAISCSYHVAENKINETLENYLKHKFGFKKVYLPELVFDLAIENRVSVNAAKKYIIEEYQKSREKFSLDNTSEIFIKVGRIDERESLLYPLYREQYISHITLLQ